MNLSGPAQRSRRLPLLLVIGPGLMVAATGVGAGDLWTASFVGENLGVAVLWAVLLGAFFKFMLTEGLARWQLATGQTVLEGAVLRLGMPIRWIFLFYLLVWSVFVGSALANACGATAGAMFAHFKDPSQTKLAWGVLHCVLGVVVVRSGGYRLFEKLMSVCIAIMFVTVVVTAVAVGPDWRAVLNGLLWPTIPQFDSGGFTWTVGLMGGVGGTLTVLCYGYWIREKNRTSAEDLRVCRIDLAVGYIMTALFGISMVIIGSKVPTGEKGMTVLVVAGNILEQQFGGWARWMFLVGAWAAVFSSLLGVWQSVPYIFADFCNLAKQSRLKDGKQEILTEVSTDAPPYRLYLVVLAVVSMFGLMFDFKQVQKYYAVLGAMFMPMLALVLLILNGQKQWVGARLRNRPATVIVLVATLGFFTYYGWTQVSSKWKPSPVAVTLPADMPKLPIITPRD